MATDLPSFRGLAVYRHLGHRFSLLYPQEWGRVDVPAEAGGGVTCFPDSADPATFLRVQSRRLRVQVRPDDLPDLRAGFLEGLRALPGLVLEREEARATGDLLDLEARHRFAEGEAVRERWVRVLYQGRVQISLSAQGSSPATFAYWLPMFNTAMRTVRFGDWWAELTGTSWQRTLPGTASPAPEAEG
jgi:hypothetical protein